MDKMSQLSKLMSYWLRHNPDDAGIVLDDNGWTDFDTFVEKSEISRETIEQIVAECPKQRFSIRDGKIRANQGHSLDLNIEFDEVTPPDVLYHGTVEKFLRPILEGGGLKPMARHHVHLSERMSTARQVGNRRGAAKVLIIDAKSMVEDGHKFWQSENGIYLADYVEPKYIIGIH
jgi:putative RNA 2'-phosphotransferase